MTLRAESRISPELGFDGLAARLAAAMRDWERNGGTWSENRFSELALLCFQLQYEQVEPYRRYCDRRGVRPGTITSWADVPPVPVAAFQRVPFIAGGESRTTLEFRTSGTTGGPASRGRHLVREPALYRASMEAAFHRLALGDRPEPLDLMSLVPPFEESSASSLAWMIDGLIARFGGPASRHVASGSGVDWTAAADFARAAAAGHRPVGILATTLALDAWLARLREDDLSWRLPAGSMVMDTGGAKGRAGLRRADVCAAIGTRLGIDETRIVNEFGMTELLSQLYSQRTGGDARARLIGPPWLRTRVLDPNDLAPLPDGEEGVLCYFDLANAGSVSAILTEDVGRMEEGGVEWLRRFPGASPRGCSLATAELLAAQGNDAGA